MPTENRAACRIASAIPGRIRVQLINSHRNSTQLQEVAARLSSLNAVEEVDIVDAAYSVIVRYGIERNDPLMVARQIEMTVFAAILDGSAEAEAATPTRTRRRRSRLGQGLSLLHSIPGRLRVRVPHLRRQQHVGFHVEKELEAKPGVHDVEVLPDHESMIVRYDPKVHKPKSLVRLVGRQLAGAARSLPSRGGITSAREIPTEPQRLNPLVLPTIAVGLGATGAVPATVAGGAVALAGLPLLSRALGGVRRRRFNVEQLDVAALGVLVSLGDFFTAGLITWLIGLGDVIRERTMRRSRRAISELMSPAQHRAWLDRDGTLVSVAVDRLQAGDVVHVYPGDQIPVDGVVTKGQALVDQKALTGEPVPVTRAVGDPVYALTIVADGQISVRVEHIGKETRAGQVVRMIEEAPLSDTRIQNYASKMGDRLVGPIFGVAGAAYLLTADPLRAASILILDFATGIRVSAPTTILSAMTGAARQGLFIKGGKAMEKLACIDAVVFDKTGTLTRGEPLVTDVHPLDSSLASDGVLRFAACAEANLKHPAARAVVDAARHRGLDIVPPTRMDYTLGGGVRAVVDGKSVYVGSERYCHQMRIDTAHVSSLTAHHHASGNSLVYVAIEERLVGLLAYSDPPRTESSGVIQGLLDRGVKRIVMLTGDNARAAQAVASRLGITDVVAEAFPEQKAVVVQSLREQGYTVAVIGDGINDSPAFTRADVSISLQHGADVAKETADVILLDGDLRGLPRAIDLSRDALRVLKQNINIIVVPTAVGMAAATVGLATPLFSTVLSNGTAVLAGLNALRPLFAKGARTLDRARLVGALPAPPSETVSA